MCGIVGKVNRDAGRPVEPALVARMKECIARRGPDGDGTWLRPPAGFGFRRLAIIDLETGDQPMLNEDGTVAVVFNGEIYNFRELRARLEALGHVFRSRSDAEVLVHGFEQWGTGLPALLRGMFAFAVFDTGSNTLFLARDRIGKKPLHYAVLNRGGAEECLVFASELGALLAIPGMKREVDLEAMSHYFAFNYVPDPLCIMQGIRKLPAAHWLTWRGGRIATERYWELEYEPKTHPGTEAEAVGETLERVEESVRARLVSDVPVGCYLSSGIDSSLVAALARRNLPGELMTFAATVAGHKQNELPIARRIAQHLGTTHHEIVIDPDPVECLAMLPWLFGEPLAHLSAPTFYYLHKWTAGHVKSILSGDGGDENFAGYELYRDHLRYRRLRSLPRGVRHGARAMLRATARALPGFGSALHRRSADLHFSLMAPEELFVDRYMGYDSNEVRRLLKPAVRAWLEERGVDSHGLMLDRVMQRPPDALVDRMMRSNWSMHMPGLTMPKADRLSMAHGMEVRSPLCDHQLMEYAAKLPAGLKFRGSQPKHLLRQAAARVLPAEIATLPKIGFGGPTREYLSPAIRPVIEGLLFDSTARSRGFFEQAYLRRIVEEHLGGTHNHRYRVWIALMFEAWCRTFLDQADPQSGPVSFG
jgi:asparagine synthase (glutamine-hydrolysing)